MSETNANFLAKRRKTIMRVTLGLLGVTVIIVYIHVSYVIPARQREAHFNKVSCAYNLASIGAAMAAYARDFSDRYPTGEKWCDLLIEGDHLPDKTLVCPASNDTVGESSYALNKYIAGKKQPEIPPDVILLFETNSGIDPSGRQGQLKERAYYSYVYDGSEKRVYALRWNQHGGPEILTTENHGGKGCNVLFNDGSVRFVKTEELGMLRWKADKTEE